jgi:hypothetical protein
VSAPPIPRVQNFLIADSVFQQAGGKWCVIGVFDRVTAVQYPVMHAVLGLFVQLSDAEGEYDVRVEFQDARGKVHGKFEGIRFVVKNRLEQGAFGLQTQHLPIPAPGAYFFKLYFNGRLSETDIRIEAVLLKQKA